VRSGNNTTKMIFCKTKTKKKSAPEHVPRNPWVRKDMKLNAHYT
jgi:hypothetical protein